MIDTLRRTMKGTAKAGDRSVPASGRVRTRIFRPRARTWRSGTMPGNRKIRPSSREEHEPSPPKILRRRSKPSGSPPVLPDYEVGESLIGRGSAGCVVRLATPQAQPHRGLEDDRRQIQRRLGDLRDRGPSGRPVTAPQYCPRISTSALTKVSRSWSWSSSEGAGSDRECGTPSRGSRPRSSAPWRWPPIMPIGRASCTAI